MNESLANKFPSFDSALDELYGTFGSRSGMRGGDLGCAETDMSDVLRLEAIEQHKDILPRTLELLGKEVGDSGNYSWLILNKVAVRWRDWPKRERLAIEVFMRAWWRAALSEYPRRLDIFTLVDITGTMGIDIRAYLSFWESRSDRPAMRHLACLVEDFTVHSAPTEEWYDVLDRWIGSMAPRRMLEAALSAESDSQTAQEISAALDIWKAWARGEGNA
ncbi:MAG: hypothetical protein JWP48_3495 [Actinoallomurus sp.]|jgi:hypothetical protein|nr:hypothetical protein [Actinoallomurus sp.]